MEIKNSHVFITGASRGIGRAFAKVCAEDKAHLHLLLRKKDPEIEKEMLAAGAASVKVWEGDMSSRQAVDKIISNFQNQEIDILFNNAGILTGALLEEQSKDEIYEVTQVNLAGLMHLTRGLLPAMLKRGRGKIVNNSSVAALMHFPCASTYAATKAGVWAFTDCLRLELKGTGVSTLCLITPGVKTRLLEDWEHRYSKNFKMPMDGLSPQIYAQMIREAVLNDLEFLEPQGLTGIGLRIARYVPKIFDLEMRRRFRR